MLALLWESGGQNSSFLSLIYKLLDGVCTQFSLYITAYLQFTDQRVTDPVIIIDIPATTLDIGNAAQMKTYVSCIPGIYSLVERMHNEKLNK